MSRFRRSIAMLLVFAMLLPMLPASAFAAAGEDFVYSVQEDGTVSIDGYVSAEGGAGEGLHVEIPSEIEGLPVTKLAQEAFAYQEQIDTLVIPASVAAIDNSAFYHCSGLKAIAFLGNAPELGFTVAEGSKQLEKLFILESCDIGAFCALLLNDLGEEETAQIEVLEYADVDSLMAAYNAYVQQLDEELAAQAEASETEPATEAATEPETVPATEPVMLYVERPFEVNPLYADVLSAEDFDLESLRQNAIQTFSDTVYTSETELVQAVREYMKNRVEAFSVSIQPGDDVTITTNEELGAYIDSVLEPLFDHTGVPTEGDYIKFQYGGYEAPASYDGTTVTFNFTVPYYTTYDQEAEMDTRVAETLAGLALDGKTDYEKVSEIYNFICACVTYDNANLEDESYLLKYTAYAALVNGTAVCQGYANLFYRLALEAGVDARIIAGVQTSTNGAHAWNIVELDNLYYNLDSTWDAGQGGAFNYFLRANDTFEDHTRDAEYTTAAFNSAYPMATADYSNSAESEEPETPVTSGTCGENVTWYFDETSATLSVSGEGAMADYAAGEMPWNGIADQIEKLVIGEGITYVGSMAFVNLTNLIRITIPSSVTQMGASAFWFPNGSSLESVYISDLAAWLRIEFGDSAANPLSNAQNLYLNGTVVTSILVPDEITEIKPYAFFSFQALTDLVLSENVTALGHAAFYACESLKNVTIHGALTSIGTEAFYMSGVEKVSFTGDAPSADDCGRLFNFYNSTVTVEYPADNATWTSEILDGDYSADIAWSPVGVEQEDSVTWSFDEATGILTISGTGAMTEDLAGMPWAVAGYTDSIKAVVIEEGITSVCGLAFDSHTNLENVILPDSMQTIEGAAFSGCTSLKTLVIPAGVTTIGDYAFANSGLEEIYFYGSRPTMGENMFSGLSSGYAYYDYQDTTWQDIYTETFSGGIQWVGTSAPVAEGVYGFFRWHIDQWNNLRIIGSGTLESQSDTSGYPWYEHRDSITHVSTSHAVNVPQHAFAGYTVLRSAALGSTITSVGTNAFGSCSALKTVNFNGDLPAIATDAFTGVTATVTYPGDNETYTDTGMQNYGGSLTWLGSFTGQYGDVSWELDRYTLYISGGTMEAQADASGYPWHAYADRINTISVYQTNVADYAFAGYENLQTLALGYQVSAVGSKAFSGCTSLTEIRIDADPFSIAEDAFEGVTAKAIISPNSQWTGAYMKDYGGNLTWTVQGYGTLVAEGTLNDGAISWNLDSYGYLCISGSGDMPDYESAEQTPWYEHAAGVTEIYITGLTGIGTYAFANLTGLTSINIPTSVTRIGSKAFSGCTSLTSIRFNGGPPAIAEDAFEGVTADASYPGAYLDEWEGKTGNFGGTLNWYYFNSQVAGGTLASGVSWRLMDSGDLYFEGTGAMDTMEAGSYPWSQYADQVTYISTGNLTSVGDYAFQNFTKLENAFFGASLTSIGAQAFGGCTSLQYIHFEGAPPAIAEDAFKDVTAQANVPYSYEADWAEKQLHYGGTLSWGVSVYVTNSGTLSNGIQWYLLENGSLNFDGEGSIETMEEGTYPWLEYADSITDVSLYGITSVGDYAFRGMTSLEIVYIQSSVTRIGAMAFADCSALTDIYFRGDAPAIAEDAFYGVTANAYYYSSGSGWNADMCQNYGGTLTWQIISDGSSSVVASGDFGESGSWTLTSDGILTISGSGEMPEYTSAAEYPWYSYESQIYSVEINGYTTIGANLFNGYTNLQNVDVRGDVTNVGSGAFGSCAVLERVWFYCDAPAFAEDSFTGTSCQIGYPSGNSTWDEISGSNVGGGNISWTSVTYALEGGMYGDLNWTVYNNGSLEFYGTGALAAPAEGEVHPWAAYQDQITSIYFYDGGTDGSLTIGAGVFKDNTNLTYVYFGDHVSAIGSSAFAGCGNLATVSFSGAAPEIAADAFTGVTADIYYPSNEEWWPTSAQQNYGGTLNWIGQSYTVANGSWGEFYWDLDSDGRLYISGSTAAMPAVESAADYPWHAYRDQITSVDIYGPTTVGDYAFQNCTKLTYVYINENVTSVGTQAFAGCTALNHLRFDGEAPDIADDALEGNTLIVSYPGGFTSWDMAKTLTYGATAIEWQSFSKWLEGGSYGGINWDVYSDGVLSLSGSSSVMDDQAEASGYPWSQYAQQIKAVNIYSVTTIGAHAFENMTALTSIYMNHDITAIGDYAFAGCTGLVQFDMDSSVTVLGNNIFDGAANPITVVFEAQAPAFAQNTFAGATVTAKFDSNYSGWTADILQSYGGTVSWVDVNAGVTGTIGNLSWVLKNGVLTISGEGGMGEDPGWKSYSNEIYSAVIEPGATSISAAAFAGLSNMTSISIPDTVTSIGGSAFGGSGLTSITIPGSVAEMGDMILAYCENLTGATFEEGVTAIPAATFEMSANLTTVSLPNTLQTIGDGAFLCTGLTEINLPEGLISIGSNAFGGTGLTEVAIPASVSDIASTAFSECNALTKISVAENNAAYCSDEQGVLYNETKTELIIMPNGYTGSYTLPATVTNVNAWTFYDKPGLTATYVENGSANYSSDEQGVLFNSDKTVLIRCPAAFTGDENGGYEIPATVIEIGENAFIECTQIQSVIIPASVDLFGGAFIRCSNLKTIYFRGNAPSQICYGTFDGVTATAYYPEGSAGWTTDVMDSFGGTITWTPYEFDTIVASGTGEDGLNWSLTTSGILTISGSGPMADYACGSTPWYAYSDSIKKIVLEEGVTSTGQYAFYQMVNLSEIVIPSTLVSIGAYSLMYSTLTEFTVPEGVQTIGRGAFWGSESLRSISLPSTLISVDYSAFLDCKVLEELIVAQGNETYCAVDNVLYSKDMTTVVFCAPAKTGTYEIPEGVTTVAEKAFECCTCLTKIVIPSTLTTFGDNTGYSLFRMTALESIDVAEDNTVFRSEDGVLFTKDGRTLIAFPRAKGTAYEVPGGVEVIGSCAFVQNEVITSVILLEGLLTIGETAFSNCSALESITLPETLITISVYAFDGCGALKNVALPDGLTTLSGRAFADCVSLTEIVIPGTVLSVGNYAFENTGLQRVEIGYGVTTLGTEAFADNTSLTEVIIPSSVTTFGTDGDAFANCTNLTIYAHADSAAYEYSQNYGFGFAELDHEYEDSFCKYCGEQDPNNGSCGDSLTWTFDDATGTLTISGTGEMYDYSSSAVPMAEDPITTMPRWADIMQDIVHVVIEEGVTTVGSNAFHSCFSLTDVSLPTTLTAIGDGAFWCNNSLTAVSIPESVTYIGMEAFASSGLTSVTVPAKVTFGEGAFYGCAALTEVTLSEGITTTGDYTFQDCDSLTDVQLPSTLQTIGEGAFWACDGLEEITLPESLKTIGDGAFNNCTALKQIRIPASVTEIGDYAFGSCSSLTAIEVDAANTVYSSDVSGVLYDAGKTRLIQAPGTLAGEYSIPATVTEIGGQAFYGCSGLESVSFLGNAPAFEDSLVFYGVTATARYPEANATWTSSVMQSYGGSITWESYEVVVASGTCGNDAVWELTSRGKLLISGTGTMTEFGQGNMPWAQYKSDITSVVIGEGITTICDYAFYQYQSLQEFSLPTTLTSIGSHAFNGVGYWNTDMVFPEGLVSIGDYAFAYNSFNSVTMPSTLKTIGAYAFYYVDDMRYVKLNEGLESIGTYAFYECQKLTGTLTIPEGITTIEPYTFFNTAITGLVLPSTLESIKNSAFYSCGGLQQLTLPEGLKSIGADAFRGCSAITGELVIPDSVTYLDGFTGCEGITGLKIGNSVNNIAALAFKNCTGLTGELVLPEGLVTIGDQAFYGCSGLTGTLTIPDSVTTLGYLTFGNCSSLTGLKLSESLAEIPTSAFAYCSGVIGELVIPDSVQTIGYSAFKGMSGLTKITFGTGLTTIGASGSYSTGEYSPFYGCSGVTRVEFTAVTGPTVNSNPFISMSSLESVYMPAEDYDSYAGVRAYLIEGVTIETEWEKIPVTGLTVERVYSKSAVLSWDAHAGSDVTGYIIYRDGEQIGTATECSFADRSLTAETEYSYTVCATFADGTNSVVSEAVTAITVLPQITKIEVKSDSGKIANVTGYNEIMVYIPAGGNLEPLGQKQASVAIYYGSDTEQVLIGYAKKNTDISSDTVVVYSLLWDLALITDGSYTVTAVLTDVDGTTAELARTLTVDNTPPAQLELVAVSSVKDISLSWSFATEVDTTIYRIYRRVGENGEFALLKQISGRDVQSYTDTDVTEEQAYYYYVVGVDSLGREGTASEIAGATLTEDTQNPRVIDMSPEGGAYLNGTVTFNAKAQDNMSVTEMVLSYSVDEGASWMELARSTSGSISGTLDTTALADGKLLVRAISYDAKGNVSDNYDNTYMIDNTGPGQVTGLSYVSTSVTMTLSWSDVADEDIGGFKVEQKLVDGTYKTVQSNVTALGINIRGLVPGTEYTYRVTAYDRLGNLGIPSEDFTATTLADTTAPVVIQLKPGSGRYNSEIAVSATVEDDNSIASVTLQYSTDAIIWYDICTEEYEDAQKVRTLSGVLNLDGISEGTLYISAVATDLAGNVTTKRTYTEHRVDKTAPNAPETVTATGGSGYIEIAWKYAETDVGEFALYRAEAEDGAFQLLQEGLLSLNFFDRNVEDEKTYYYQVAVRDTAGNWSVNSETASAASLPDTEAPQVISVYPADGKVIGINNTTVSVLASDNSALYSILIEYSADGENYETLSETTDIGVYNMVATGTLPVADFQHGDTIHIRATATDMEGLTSNVMVSTLILDTEAPAVSAVQAVYADEDVTVTWSGLMESDLAGYRIYRKLDGGSYSMIGQVVAVAEQSAYTFTDSNLSTSGGTYTYLIQAVDNVNNVSSMASESVVVPVRSTPKAVISSETTMIVNAEYIIDGSASTDNSAIVSYLFDFGDGTTSEEVSPVHVYTAAGTYTITLTVTDDEGNTNTATQTVTVETDELIGTAEILIVDEKGAPVPDAPVYFDLGEETQIIKLTDSSGKVTFTATVGKHTVGCIIPNNEWLPVKHDMIVTAGATSSTTMTLVNKPLVEGSFEVKRMTLEEIVAAGIDITAAENQNYVQVDINLTYNNMTVSESIPAGVGFTPIPGPIIVPTGGGGGEDDDDDDDEHTGGNPDPGPVRILTGGVLRPYEFSEEVTVILLDIPVGVSTLKEFFDVRLHVINNATSEFYLIDNTVTLNVPSGLTLMDVDGKDGQVVNIAQIRGQTTETLEWILRGDAIGEYYLDADFRGILAEFNETIEAKFKAEEPIQVYGMSNLRLIVDVADELDKGTLYYNVSLVNEGDIDVYRPSITVDDDLIEIEFFDATGADQAEKYDFNAESIEKEDLSTNLSQLPDVLKPGERLTMHYMNVDETVYTECVMALKKSFLDDENSLGLETELIERPVSFFTANLNATVNALEKAQNTLVQGEAKTAYSYLTNNTNYVYWAMANDLENLGLKKESEEQLFETLKGDFGDAFGENNKDYARAMVLASVDIAAEENTYAGYDNMLNWLALFREVVKNNLTGIEVTQEQAEAFGFALDEIEANRKWELYVAIHGSAYQSVDKLFVDMWCDGLLIEPSEEMKNLLHKIYASKPMEKVWEKIGVKNDMLSSFTEIMSDVASDVSIYVAAQSNIDTINFYLDALINNIGSGRDADFVKSAAEDVRSAINTESIMSTVINNTLEEGFWTALATGPKIAVEAAKKHPIVNAILTGLEIGAEVMDTLFNLSKQYEVANNVRYLEVISDSIVKAVKTARTEFTSDGSEANAKDYMMLLSYLIDLRMLGESQAAQYGVTFEQGVLPTGSWVMFDAACDYTDAPGDVETWYEWRDFVEDKLSRFRVTLLKDPLSYDVNEYTAPAVTFNYAEGQTVQSFSADYEYSLDGGTTWTACTDAPISVAQVKNSIELWVRRTDTSETQEKMTTAVTIIGPDSLQSDEIEVIETATGYRIDGLDNERTYTVTFSETAQSYDYNSTLATSIPAGSYYYEYSTETEYAYVYIRALADTDHYASYIYSAPIYAMVTFTATIDGQGTVTADEIYEYGESVGLAATPADGWLFEGWYSTDAEGTATKLSSDPGYLFSIWENTNLTAKFIEVSSLENNGNLDATDKQAIGFGEETSVETVVSYYENLGLTATVTDAQGNAITDGNVGTGSVITVGGAEYTVVVKGDVDGDGIVNLFDVADTLSHVYGESVLEGAYFDAAKISSEDDVMLFDVLAMLDMINGV